MTTATRRTKTARTQRGSRIVEFASRELGLELSDGQAEAVATFEAGGYEQAVWRWGRRSGKSLMADVLALYDATVRDGLRSKVRPGEPRVSAIICPRVDQSQSHIRNIANLVRQSPRLSRLLLAETSDELSFAGGSVIKAFPCSARSIRGGAWSSCILDELGHYMTSEDGNAAGDRVLEAALPSLAQFGTDAWLIAISTPLWKAGAFWKLCERAESGRFDYIQSQHGSTAAMNPRISARWLEDRRREDPDAFAREFEARWIDGAGSYLNSSEVTAAVRHGIGTLGAASGTHYAGAIDAAYSGDAFAMGVGHRAPDGRIVVDGVWTWKRHGHEATIAAVAEVANRYALRAIRIDQHAAQPIREALQRHDLRADYQPWTNESKSNAFSALKVSLNTRAIELPDDSALVEELCGLEARPTPNGLIRIAASGSGHDDRAVVVASLAHQLRSGRGSSDAELASLCELNHQLRATGGRHTRYPLESGIGIRDIR